MALLDRGVRILAVYTGSASDRYNYTEQFFDAFREFGLRGRVDCEFFPHVNHTFTELFSQKILCDRVSEWLTTAFPSPWAEREKSTAGRTSLSSVMVATEATVSVSSQEPETIPQRADGSLVVPKRAPISVEAAASGCDIGGRGPCAVDDQAPAVRVPGKAFLIERQMDLIRSQMALVERLREIRGR